MIIEKKTRCLQMDCILIILLILFIVFLCNKKNAAAEYLDSKKSPDNSHMEINYIFDKANDPDNNKTNEGIIYLESSGQIAELLSKRFFHTPVRVNFKRKLSDNFWLGEFIFDPEGSGGAEFAFIAVNYSAGKSLELADSWHNIPTYNNYLGSRWEKECYDPTFNQRIKKFNDLSEAMNLDIDTGEKALEHIKTFLESNYLGKYKILNSPEDFLSPRKYYFYTKYGFANRQELIEFVKGSSYLSMSGINNWDSFIDRLKYHNNPAIIHIWQLLDRSCRETIEKYNPHEVFATKYQTNTIIGLNQILERRDFYDSNAFKNILIDKEAKDLLEKGIKNLNQKEIQELNTRLIESLFPNIISKHPLKDRKIQSPIVTRKNNDFIITIYTMGYFGLLYDPELALWEFTVDPKGHIQAKRNVILYGTTSADI